MEKKTIAVVLIVLMIIIAGGMLAKRYANRHNPENQSQLNAPLQSAPDKTPEPAPLPKPEETQPAANTVPQTPPPAVAQQPTADSGELESIFGGISEPDTNTNTSGLNTDGMI